MSDTRPPKPAAPMSEDAFRALCLMYHANELDEAGFAALTAELDASATRRSLFVEVSMQIETVYEAFEQQQAEQTAVELGITDDDEEDDDAFDIMTMVVDQALELRRQHEIEDEANRQLAAQQAEDARNRRFELRRQAAPEAVRRVIVIPKALVYLGLAAVIGLVATVIYHLDEQPPETPQTVVESLEADRVVTQDTTVALLLDAYRPVWGGAGRGQNSPEAGERLQPGEYVLQSGAVQIAFDRGATTLIEGPARFELIDDNAGRLTLGNLTAQVPESAYGFRIDLPNGRVTDLGTAFGVRIHASGVTETTVFTGIIEAQALAPTGALSAPLRLTQGDGARLVERGAAFESQPIDPRLFARELRDVSHNVRVAGEAKLLDTPPVTVEVDQLEDHTTAFVFREREGVRLTSRLSCGITEPGHYTAAALRRASATLAPQAVDSFLIHSDTEFGKYGGPMGTPSYILEMTIVFPQPVVAVLTHTDQMVASDALLGSPATRYDAYAGRSLVERSSTGESVAELWLSEDRRTLRVTMHASNVDQLRVLTESDAY